MRKQVNRDARSFTNVEAVTLAVLLAGGDLRAVDTEDVAVKAHGLAPQHFCWAKYAQHINLDAVRRRLGDARDLAHYVTGSGSNGWMLTALGLQFALAAIARIPSRSSRVATTLRTARWRKGEQRRMLATEAYAKFAAGNLSDVTRQEAERFFRIDEYVATQARHQKVARLCRAFSDDPRLGPAVAAIATTLGVQSAEA
jgi:hypothetical protein